MNHSFDEKHTIHELKHYLPEQAPLNVFIHQNSLHAFQKLKFYDAIRNASKIFGYKVSLQLEEYRSLYKIGRIRKDILDRIIIEKKGVAQLDVWKENLQTKAYDTSNNPRIGKIREIWENKRHINLDNLVHPLLFRILCSYLDQGVSIWNFPIGNNGFLSAIKEIEKNSFTSFFKTKRAKEFLLNDSCEIQSLLKIIVGDESLYTQYLFDQQFAHQGWSGLISSVENQPDSLLDPKNITIHDLIVFELLLEIDCLDAELGTNWLPLSNFIENKPTPIFSEVPETELNEVIRLWQDAFEWSYYDNVLAAIQLETKNNNPPIVSKSFQALFCIDEREESLRRHIEKEDNACETFGTPGFFTVEFYFQSQGAKFYVKLCPAPVTPKYLIKEFDVTNKREHEILYTQKTHTFFWGFLSAITLGFIAALKTLLTLFRPRMSPAISNAFTHMQKHSQLTVENKNIEDKENNLQIGFTILEMTDRVESLLRSIGLISNFAPIVYVIGHGSSSANNPHHSAHDCGACSGKPGSANARVFATMANNPKVREMLKSRNLEIPIQTQFIGGMHDTSSDQIGFYDEMILSDTNQKFHLKNKESFENALDLDAKERSRRFASINTKMEIKKVRKAILNRSVSLFEPRPEFGHGTNSMCIVGSRNITKGLFLDRRAFMNSYNYKTDLDGKLLFGVMKPIGLVCGGINLEYYFSRVDNYKFGSGTKLPHNIMGLFGVANGSDGDLRPGLPLQMIEVHDPIRLLIVVEHFPEVVVKTIQALPEMYEWYINEWVHLVVLNPETKKLFYFKDGDFSEYHPLTEKIETIDNVKQLIESSIEVESLKITDMTHENFPIYFNK